MLTYSETRHGCQVRKTRAVMNLRVESMTLCHVMVSVKENCKDFLQRSPLTQRCSVNGPYTSPQRTGCSGRPLPCLNAPQENDLLRRCRRESRHDQPLVSAEGWSAGLSPNIQWLRSHSSESPTRTTLARRSSTRSSCGAAPPVRPVHPTSARARAARARKAGEWVRCDRAPEGSRH